MKINEKGIGIAEKSHETGRDRWGSNVNHKFLACHILVSLVDRVKI